MNSTSLSERFVNLLFHNRNDIAVSLTYSFYHVANYIGDKRFFKGEFGDSYFTWTQRRIPTPVTARFYLDVKRCLDEKLFELYEVSDNSIKIYTGEMHASLSVYYGASPNEVDFQGRIVINLEEGCAPRIIFIDNFKINYANLKTFPEYEPITKEFLFSESGNKTKSAR